METDYVFRIGGIFVLVILFFALGYVYQRHYPNNGLVASTASIYNSQPKNNVHNYNGNSLQQTSSPQIGIGGGAPTTTPNQKINYCQKK